MPSAVRPGSEQLLGDTGSHSFVSQMRKVTFAQAVPVFLEIGLGSLLGHASGALDRFPSCCCGNDCIAGACPAASALWTTCMEGPASVSASNNTLSADGELNLHKLVEVCSYSFQPHACSVKKRMD